MTRVNASFLNTAAQLNHPLLMKIHQYFADMVLPVIKPSTRGFLRTADLLEKNAKAKDEILQLLDKADIGFKDIIIEHEDIKEITLDGRSFKTAGPSTRIYFSHHYDDDVQLPFSDESDGTQRFFTLAGPLFEILNNNKFLCIDEIEMSLHEELLEYFLKTFLRNSSGSQIMFTTHNQDLLDSDVLRNDEIWFVEKNKTGGSELFSLIEFKDVPENVSRRKLYKAGGFGAVPLILHRGRA
jgi:AAA15 family ATPase/GTPase